MENMYLMPFNVFFRLSTRGELARKPAAALQRTAEGADARKLSILAALTNRNGRCTTPLPVCYSCIGL
ncbi:hypothetical protein ABIA00_003468 [Bradyrhizobium ottawaense]